MSFYDDASWLLIPSGIEEDVVFAQKPTSGLGDLTFTRASDATYTDITGVVRRSPYNLLQFSEMFSDASWAKRSATISANVINAPNGTLTADKIVEAASTGFHSILQSNASRVGVPYTFSVYLKAAERTWALVWFDAESAGAYVNLSTGELGTVSSGVTASVTSVGDGWYRCVISKNIVIGAGVAVYTATSNGGASYVGNGTSGIFAWGAQLVEGTSALDYFPTTNRQDVPRIDFRNADGTLSSCGRLLLEPQRTNSIRNSSMVGAVAGTPGTLPTNWIAATGGLSQTVIGIGTENGLPYIDYKLAGTATSTEAVIRFEGPSQIAASASQSWTSSIYSRLISAAAAPNSYNLITVERNSGGASVAFQVLAYVPTSTLRRFTQTFTTTATTAFVQPGVVFVLTSGATYDFTIRIAAPQMELGSYATTWVPTTTAAVTRIADTASKTGVSSLIGQTQGTWFCEIDLSKLLGTTARDFFAIGDGRIPASASAVYCSFSGIGSNLLRARVVQSGVVKYDQRHTITATGTYKIALAYKSQDCAMYVNGSFVGTVAQDDPFAISLNQIFTSFDSSTFQFGDGINQAALFPTRLDNATLAQLTTL